MNADRCNKIGHNFREVKSAIALGAKSKRERCLDCGREETFTERGWNADAEYAKAHRRDFIQPWQKEEWALAYPDKPIVTDPARQKDMGHELTVNVGKKRMGTIADEYLRSFGWHNEAMTKVLRWHFNLE